MTNRVELAISRFEEGLSCSQALLAAYGPRFGLSDELALRIADAFGGGMGVGSICGAVTGALMVIGLKYGRLDAQDNQAKEKVRELSRELMKQFETCCGSVVCRELLGCDISTPEGLAQAREKGLFTSLCPGLVREAAEIVGQMVCD